MNLSKFEIKVDPKASRDIKKLQHANPTVTKRIIKIIDSLSFNPYSGKHLKGENKVAIPYEVEITALSTKYILPKK